ncbi:MAG: choice-of-anchor I family protein [Rhodospirillales bacterium]
MRTILTGLCGLMLSTGMASALELKEIGSARIGVGEGYAEMLRYQSATGMIIVTSSAKGQLSRIDISNPSHPLKAAPLDLEGGEVTAVAIHRDLVAASTPGKKAGDAGHIILFGKGSQRLATAETGPLPDNLAFSPDGRFVISANEGQPSKDYKTDPAGGFTILDLIDGPDKPRVRQVSLYGSQMPDGARIVKPGASFASDAEPEYVTVDSNSRTAYATLQENNALAVIDLPAATVTGLYGFGFKSISHQPHDMSDKDGGVNMRSWPVRLMYQPDAIQSYRVGGETYLVTANEGDSKDYDGFSEETRVAGLKLDPDAFPDAEILQKPENLGRMKTTTTLGDTDGDGDHDQIYGFGGRSFSIWTTTGKLLFDSGNAFEAIIAGRNPELFNADGRAGEKDNRSDDKGPEPEALVLGAIDGRHYAFIGMERNNAIFAYDITNPVSPQFAGYLMPDARHNSPEGLDFIPAAESPNGKPLLIAAFEVSGTVAVYELKP